METLDPGVSADAAGEAVEAATPELDQQNEGQQVTAAEVTETEATDNDQAQSEANEIPQGDGSDATESKSQRQRRLKRERQADRDRKLAEARKRLEDIEKQESELKDPTYEEVDDPDRRIAVMAANEARRYQMQTERDRITGEMQAAQAEAEREWAEKSSAAEADAKQRYSDYDAKVGVLMAVTRGQPNRAIQDALRNSDTPADLAYFLGNNPEDAARINSLPDLAAAREIGRIEAGLNIPKPKTKTTAPVPIKPLAAGSAEPLKNPEDMTFSEYEAARRAGKL